MPKTIRTEPLLIDILHAMSCIDCATARTLTTPMFPSSSSPPQANSVHLPDQDLCGSPPEIPIGSRFNASGSDGKRSKRVPSSFSLICSCDMQSGR